MKYGSVIKYLNFRIVYYLLGFITDQTDHNMELVNEWFPDRKFRKFDTPVWTDSAYDKELTATVTLRVDALQKT